MSYSKLGLQVWTIACYLDAAGLKEVSIMKFYRDLEVTQEIAWFLAQRLRKSFELSKENLLNIGLNVTDETFIGSKESNQHWDN